MDLLIGHDLAGTYTLSLEIGGECAIAEFAKKRTYTATVTPAGRRFLVTLTDAVFATPCGSNSLAPGLGCNQFMIEGTDSGFRLSMIELDWGDGAHIQERLQDGSWLYVAGWGSGRTEGSALEVVATADTFHCRGSSPTLTESCRAGGTYCRTDDLRLRFVPK